MDQYFSINSGYLCRPVQLTDAEALNRVVWPDYRLDIVQDLLGRVLEMMASDRALGLVVIDPANGQQIGYGQITRWPRVAEISDLAVAADYRNRGIGSALIETLITNSSPWRLTQIEIGAAQNNPRALALYRRLGFNPVRQVELDLGHGPEAVFYLSRLQFYTD